MTQEFISRRHYLCLFYFLVVSTTWAYGAETLTPVDPAWRTINGRLVTGVPLSTKSLVKLKIESIAGQPPDKTSIRLSGQENEKLTTNLQKVDIWPKGPGQINSVELADSANTCLEIGTLDWLNSESKGPRFVPWKLVNFHQRQEYTEATFSYYSKSSRTATPDVEVAVKPGKPDCTIVLSIKTLCPIF